MTEDRTRRRLFVPPPEQLSAFTEQQNERQAAAAEQAEAESLSLRRAAGFRGAAEAEAGEGAAAPAMRAEVNNRAEAEESGGKQRLRRNFGALLRHSRRSLLKRGINGARKREDYHAQAEFPLQSALVPKDDMHGFALLAVLAIMSFLAAWMLFAAYFIGQSAQSWSRAIAREAMVQIMPVPGQNIEKAQAEAANIAKSFSGIADIRSVSAAETQNLLAPWLGANADIAALPVPRLVVLRLVPGAEPDFDGLNAALQQNLQGVRFDSRQVFAGRLQRGAHFMLAGVLALLFLVLAAMVLTVIFAARGALAGNMHIVEVLHFIGADDRFIARRFDGHFFRAGLKGAAAGGAAACGLFMLLFIWAGAYRATPEGSQMAALFGSLTPNWLLAAEILALIFSVALLTMATGHWTLIRRLRLMDKKSSVFFAGRI